MSDKESKTLTINEQIYLSAVARAVRRICGKLPPAFDRDGVDPDAGIIEEAERLSMGGNLLDDMPCELRSILGEVGGASIHKVVGDDHFPNAPGTQDVEGRLDRLRKALDVLPAKASPRVTADNALDVLFNHATTMACSPTLDDVSLYDQTGVMTAIAVCLAAEEVDPGAPFLLVGGDLSGIQNYIYQIVSKHAAKSLKGRSFYVRLLADAVVRVLIDRLGLCRANMIYCSGGSFFILAPNNETTRNALNETRDWIEERIYLTHGTAIYMAIASVPLTHNQVQGTGLSQQWTELFKCRDRCKQQRYAQLIARGDFFEPQPVNNDLCDALTGEDLLKEECEYREGIDGKLSCINAAQIDLGTDLKKCKGCIVSTDGEGIEPGGLGIKYKIVTDANEVAHDTLPPTESMVLYNSHKAVYRAWSIRTEYLGGNRWSETFEKMCENEDGKFKRLGVLRMDVDNLGSIFQHGLEQNKTSLARYAALSRSFDWFFSCYINEIRTDVDSVGDNSFVLYSGGDDLFVVGDWQVVIDFAHEIRKEFRAYTCENTIFSISGGIVLTGAKFPIITAAKLSGEEESDAKKHQCAGNEKNAIVILGRALNWEKEFPAVCDLAKKIAGLLKDEYLPKSFVTKILLNVYNAKIKDHRVTNKNVYWQLAYDLHRMANSIGGDKGNWLESIVRDSLSGVFRNANGEKVSTNYISLELLELAARWAELIYRTNTDNI